MSLETATSEIRSRIEAIAGLTEIADRRVDSLKNAGTDNVDGSFLFRVSTPYPWPELSQAPKSYQAPCFIEVGSFKNDTEEDLQVDLDAYIRSIIFALRYQPLAESTLWDFSDPINEIPPLNPKVRICRINMRIRYEG